jgi:hypothetical protein
MKRHFTARKIRRFKQRENNQSASTFSLNIINFKLK